MPMNRLTQHRIDTLKSRRKTCDIRDSEIKGFGVRILPSGRKRYFLHSQIAGNRIWHAIGNTENITLERAHTQARRLCCKVWLRGGELSVQAGAWDWGMSDFKGRHFGGEIVRWYCRYPISYRDPETMMTERGVAVDRSTIYRWVQHYAPEMEKRLRRPQSRGWRIDETLSQGPRQVGASVPGGGQAREHD